MNVRHQYGHLRSVKRKAGPPAGEYLWRELINPVSEYVETS
jgi:hypothetical protein